MKTVIERILHYCRLSTGGVATNAHHQASALAELGAEVVLLCSPEWTHAPSQTIYKQMRILRAPPRHGTYSRFKSRLLTARSILESARTCERVIRQDSHRNVLLASYLEYLAPLWAYRFRRLERQGVWFGAMALDPVRDYVVGPAWWHRKSIAAGYSFLNDAFVHHPIAIETFSRRQVAVTVLPHGEYPMPAPTQSREAIRARFGIAATDRVLLCYGHLRDNKNLKVSIDAIAKLDRVRLVVAGSEASPGQIQSAWYKEYARKQGVFEKVHWEIGYQSDQATSDLFAMADVALLPYDPSFVSSSGVLHVAVPFKVPLIASCGEGALSKALEEYKLGIRIPSADPLALANAIQAIDSVSKSAKWEEYRKEHTYRRNAELLVERIHAYRGQSSAPSDQT